MHSNRNTSPPSFKTIAEQIVSTWPKLTTEQQAVVGSVMRRD
jgi:hypothetical protein